MRKGLFTALAAGALLSGGALVNSAGAMTIATPSALGVASAEGGLVQKAAVVCGYYRCVRVWPRYRYGYYYRPYAWYGRRWYW